MISEHTEQVSSPTTPDFFRLYGFSIFAFNRAEQEVKELLTNLAAGGMHSLLNPMAVILTSEMGSRSITQALQSIAHELLDEEQNDRVKHAVLMFDAILAYRNYYVHGINWVMGEDPASDPNANPVGHIKHTASKGKVAIYEDRVTIDDLNRLIASAQSLERYVTQLRFHLFFPNGGGPPLPDKPTLPAKLVKQQRWLKELLRPPRSSQE